MINVNLFHFISALSLLGGEQRVALERIVNEANAIVREDDMNRFLPKFKYASDWFERLNLNHSRQRAERLATQLRIRESISHILNWCLR
jgi:hypothetical protein